MTIILVLAAIILLVAALRAWALGIKVNKEFFASLVKDISRHCSQNALEATKDDFGAMIFDKHFRAATGILRAKLYLSARMVTFTHVDGKRFYYVWRGEDEVMTEFCQILTKAIKNERNS